jgi:hypothetical protein
MNGAAVAASDNDLSYQTGNAKDRPPRAAFLF